MRHIRYISVIFGIFAASCTTTPLPQDLSGATTLQIVQKIRCEARDAVTKYAIKYLTDKRRPADTRSIGEEIRAEPRKLAQLRLASLDKDTRDYFLSYYETYLYYEFTLDISEGSTNGAGISLLHTFGNGTHGLDLSASLDRSNQNTRTFRIGDTILDLMDLYLTEDGKHYQDHCSGEAVAKSNRLYPITGQIGLIEFIDTFAELDHGKALKPKENVDEFVQTMVFLTTVKGGISPTIVLSSIGGNVALTEAGIDSSVIRVDKHQVILSIAAQRGSESKDEVKKRAKKNLNDYKLLNDSSVRGLSVTPSSLQILQLQ
ncbi:hypothetical protein [Rhizobium leguminosarum]